MRITAMSLGLLLAGWAAATPPLDPPGQSAQTEPANEFARQNPDYRQRAGTFYEKEYLPKAVDQLAEAVGADASRKAALGEVLWAFIVDWLEEYVRGGGKMDASCLDGALRRMDERFRPVLNADEFSRYWLWRIGEAKTGNALAFLFHYKPPRPRPAFPPDDDKIRRLDAVDRLAKTETPEATVELMVMMDTIDQDVLLYAARALSDRLPVPDYPGRGCPFTDLRRDQARRSLAAKAWHPRLAMPARAFSRELLKRRSMDEAGVGAMMMVCIGQPADLPAVTEAMGRFLDATADPEAKPAYMPAAFDPFLMASQGLLYLGAKPAAAPKTAGEIAVYLGALAVLPDRRPEDWRQHCIAWRAHPVPFIRHIAEKTLVGEYDRQPATTEPAPEKADKESSNVRPK